MSIKESDFEGLNIKVKKQRRVEHPGFEKQLLKFVFERKNDSLSEDLVVQKADRMRVRYVIEDHDLNISID